MRPSDLGKTAIKPSQGVVTRAPGRGVPTFKHSSNLTDKQASVLRYIMSHVQLKGYPPSIRDVSDVMGCSTIKTGQNYLSALELKGFIECKPNTPRGIRVLMDALETPVHLAYSGGETGSLATAILEMKEALDG